MSRPALLRNRPPTAGGMDGDAVGVAFGGHSLRLIPALPRGRQTPRQGRFRHQVGRAVRHRPAARQDRRPRFVGGGCGDHLFDHWLSSRDRTRTGCPDACRCHGWLLPAALRHRTHCLGIGRQRTRRLPPRHRPPRCQDRRSRDTCCSHPRRPSSHSQRSIRPRWSRREIPCGCRGRPRRLTGDWSVGRTVHRT